LYGLKAVCRVKYDELVAAGVSVIFDALPGRVIRNIPVSCCACSSSSSSITAVPMQAARIID
jgi:hypothetical protein